MNGAALRAEVWRDEKLRLLQRRRTGLAERDVCPLPCWPRLPLFKLPPDPLALAAGSLPLLLRLWLRPHLMLGLDVWLPACLAVLDAGIDDPAGSFGK